MTDDVIIEIKWAALLAEFIFSYNICYSTVVHVKKILCTNVGTYFFSVLISSL